MTRPASAFLLSSVIACGGPSPDEGSDPGTEPSSAVPELPPGPPWSRVDLPLPDGMTMVVNVGAGPGALFVSQYGTIRRFDTSGEVPVLDEAYVETFEAAASNHDQLLAMDDGELWVLGDGEVAHHDVDGAVIGSVFLEVPDLAQDPDTYINRLQLAPDGVWVAGAQASRVPETHDVGWITRLDSGLMVDPSFGSDGFAAVSFEQVDRRFEVNRLATTASGRIVAGADTNSYVPALALLEPDGSPVPTFGVDGIVTTELGTQGIGDLVVDDQDRIVVGAGDTLARYSSAGVLDLTFAGNGQLDLPSDATVKALRMTPEGIAVIGLLEVGDAYQLFWGLVSDTGEVLALERAEQTGEGLFDVVWEPTQTGARAWVVQCTEVGSIFCSDSQVWLANVSPLPPAL